MDNPLRGKQQDLDQIKSFTISKQWHEKFDSVMIKDGFTINECDKCVYTKTVGNACIIVCLYVDDMLILGTNIEIIKSTKRMLSNNFDMMNLGLLM